MKTTITYCLLIALCMMLLNCSGNDDLLSNVQQEQEEYPNEEVVPDENNNVELKGYPKAIKNYHNDTLGYNGQYYYRNDGQLNQFKFGHSVLTHPYFHNYIYVDAKLEKIEGSNPDGYWYKFYWENGRIVKAEQNNSWWGKSEILYTYNAKEQIIQKLENYPDNPEVGIFKTNYSYDEEGNLIAIEEYNKVGSEEFDRFQVTEFGGYTGDKNLFPEVYIIPGLAVQQYFPSYMKIQNKNSTEYNETYQYTYDSEGRVIEKKFGNQKVVYEYH